VQSFDLLFGRSVAGPLSLVKTFWLHGTDLGTAKQNVVEFMLSTRERLRHVVDLATEHATQQRTKAKRWYDRRELLYLATRFLYCFRYQESHYLPSSVDRT